MPSVGFENAIPQQSSRRRLTNVPIHNTNIMQTNYGILTYTSKYCISSKYIGTYVSRCIYACNILMSMASSPSSFYLV